MNRVVIALSVVLLSVILAIAWVAFHFYGEVASQKKELTQVQSDLAASQLIVKSQSSAAVAANSISGDVIHDQQSSVQKITKTQVVIQKVLVTAPCAAVAVPADAANSVLDKFLEVSASAANTNTSKPSGAVPAVTTTK